MYCAECFIGLLLSLYVAGIFLNTNLRIFVLHIWYLYGKVTNVHFVDFTGKHEFILSRRVSQITDTDL